MVSGKKEWLSTQIKKTKDFNFVETLDFTCIIIAISAVVTAVATLILAVK